MSEIKRPGVKVEKRKEAFAEKASTKITREIPSRDNPYAAEGVYWHGYDALQLARKRSLVDVVFLLIKGELPTPLQARQLEQLMILLANPGPRSTASRSVSAASISKTDPRHWLPIGMALNASDQHGASAVEDCVRFLRRHMPLEPQEVAQKVLSGMPASWEGDCYPAPGFGSYFGGTDLMAIRYAESFKEQFPDNEAFRWGFEFCRHLSHLPASWLLPAVAAAVFIDLGITPSAGAGLFQLAAAPGLLAQGIELSGKPLTAAPFISDEDYIYEGVARDES